MEGRHGVIKTISDASDERRVEVEPEPPKPPK
jgi:hypothetical protein